MNTHQEVVRESRISGILRALSQLPPELRKVILLRYFDELTYEGVASTLGWEPWKAKKKISEALSSLRELCGVQVIQIAPGYEVRYLPHFLPGPEADSWLARLLAAVPFQPETITMRGKQFVLKRQTALYGANYDYNPAANQTHAWCPPLTDLRLRLSRQSGFGSSLRFVTFILMAGLTSGGVAMRASPK
jgi:alkylated DNA repair dioxygenase AlkB